MSVSVKINKKEIDYLNGLNPKRCNVLFLEVGEIGAILKVSGVITDSKIGKDITFDASIDLISSLSEPIFIPSVKNGANIYPSETRLYQDDETLEKFLKEQTLEESSVIPRYLASIVFKNCSYEDLEDDVINISYNFKPTEFFEDDKKIETLIARAYEMWEVCDEMLIRECFTSIINSDNNDIKKIAIESFKDKLKVHLTDQKNVVKNYEFTTFSNLVSFLISSSILTLDLIETLKTKWKDFTTKFPNIKGKTDN